MNRGRPTCSTDPSGFRRRLVCAAVILCAVLLSASCGPAPEAADVPPIREAADLPLASAGETPLPVAETAVPRETQDTGRFPAETAQAADSPSAAELTGRVSLLQTLKSQLGSRGEILDPDDSGAGYYTQWYVGGTYKNGWNEDTPWCAAFVSWAIARAGVSEGTVEDFSPFASVEAGEASFRSGENGSWLEPDETPLPGDLVFFDWDSEGEADHGKPDHVGVVTRVDDEGIHTLEGNAGGLAAAMCYPSDDPRILGFGVLRWAA